VFVPPFPGRPHRVAIRICEKMHSGILINRRPGRCSSHDHFDVEELKRPRAYAPRMREAGKFKEIGIGANAPCVRTGFDSGVPPPIALLINHDRPYPICFPISTYFSGCATGPFSFEL